MRRTFKYPLFALIVLLIWVCFSSLIYAEFYRYKDENGVLRFTDNLAEVPEDQQPEVKNYKEPDDFLTPEQRAERARKESEEIQEAVKKEVKKKKEARKAERRSMLDGLKKEKAALDTEIAELEKEEQALTQQREKGLITNEAINAYNERMKKFKKRVAAYNKRQKAYNENLKAFNAAKTKK
ncbi:DUF4124 domain-containing protein [Desulfobacterales bacterium HSG2]|nr:DUF4124 domain-containing protein [Desulfobacterales bacterium HSG2]